VITLYGMSSPNVEKIVIMLEEQGLPYTFQHVDIFAGAQEDASIRALSPLGKVPILVDGQTHFESGAILLYLAETYGGFLPSAAEERHDVIQWLMVQMSSVGPALGQNTHFLLLGDKADPYARARFATQARKIYEMLEKRLATREWLAAGSYSVADIATFPWSRYLERHGFVGTDYPALSRWRAVIEARPAVRSAASRLRKDIIPADQRAMRNATDAQLDRFFGRDADAPPADFSIVRTL
jgi:GST-like protein